MKTVSDLLEDAKKRTVLLCIWVLGLSYLMSLTSNSIWVNIPVALFIIAMMRSLSGEIQIRWRTRQTSSFPAAATIAAARSTRVPRYRRRDAIQDARRHSASGHTVFELWRLGVEAPEVEAALEEITNSAVKEWVTNLWFSHLSKDQEFPDELANMINNVFAEFSRRVKRINLITLLTQDIVDLVASHLELFRRTQARVGADILGILSSEERDENLKQAMVAAGELHPALVSADSEYKVLHKLMGGLITLVMRPEDGNCGVARTLSRELLACAVMRPVMNLLNPAFINTLIENAAAQSQNRTLASPESAKAPAKRTPDRPATISTGREPADSGLEMMPQTKAVPAQEELSARGDLKSSSSEVSLTRLGASSGEVSSKLSKSEVSSALFPVEGVNVEGAIVPRKLEGRGHSGNFGVRGSKEDWAQLLEVVNQRKTMALAPEHLDNLWAKGRNYKRKHGSKPSSKSTESSIIKEPSISHPLAADSSVPPPKPKPDFNSKRHAELVELRPVSTESPAESNASKPEAILAQEEWKAAKPLESVSAAPRPMRKSRSIGAELDGWQALAHPADGIPSLLQAGDAVGLGPGFELDLALKKRKGKHSQLEGTDSLSISNMLLCNQLQVDVVGAHFEKGGSKTFAVYSIFVTDLQNRTWEVQRRFRNFEQLHRSLKDKPYYNLCLPAKRFLSSNLDNSFIRQRCQLLDKYLKDLLAIPSIAELHEVWDFLSANSQTYAFGESPSMFKTLTSNMDDAVDDMIRHFSGSSEVKPPLVIPPARDTRKALVTGNISISPTTSHLPILTNALNINRLGLDRKTASQSIWEAEGESAHDGLQQQVGSGWLPEYDLHPSAPLSSSPYGSEPGMLDAQRDAQIFEGKLDRALSEGNSPVGSLTGSDMAEDENLAIPPDWGPPKVSVPLLNLVDVIFELQGRGWIRRQVFWMAKQVLQLGMGDAIDDFLLGKIQELRREEVVAGGIRWLHRVLWPDGIFLTKHPSRQANNNQGSFEQRLEAARRAGVVREIILDRAPAGLVSLIGRKQYQRCAKDLYFFLQSAVCLKQLTYSLLELLLLSAFPELQDVVSEVRNL